MRVKEEEEDEIIVKVEHPNNCATLPLGQFTSQSPSIVQQCLMTERSTGCDEVDCTCEECIGALWITREDGHQIKVKFDDEEKETNPGFNVIEPEETNEPMSANIDSFFGDEEKQMERQMNTEMIYAQGDDEIQVADLQSKCEAASARNDESENKQLNNAVRCTDANELPTTLTSESEVNLFICAICGRSFKEIGYLKVHQWIHDTKSWFDWSKKRKVVYSVGGKEFPCDASLKAYQNIPSDELVSKLKFNMQKILYPKECIETTPEVHAPEKRKAPTRRLPPEKEANDNGFNTHSNELCKPCNRRP